MARHMQPVVQVIDLSMMMNDERGHASACLMWHPAASARRHRQIWGAAGLVEDSSNAGASFRRGSKTASEEVFEVYKYRPCPWSGSCCLLNMSVRAGLKDV